MRALEHIGIAVRSLQEAIPRWERLLGVPCYKIEEVPSEGVRTAFFRVGAVKIELLEATRPDSPIARFLERRGEGIHHLAFAVDDVRQALIALGEKGFAPLHEEPRPGADNKWVGFFHPRSANGVLVEVCQDREES
jgi:methylmalonyl-CoA/ethylmalonyl-CoA epimerase|nr:MAG: methylmalonyl-CoA epimerase [Bacteroidota bacterium]